MKTGIIAFITATLILSGCSATSSTAKKEQAAANFEKTANLIESGNYKFTIRSASPAGGKTIQITSLYTLKAMEGNYKAYLPYFGRAYSGGYGESGGVEFNGEPENLKITRNDNKNKISVAFTIKSDTEQYKVNLQVGASGYGNLVISSQKRQTISYYGLTDGLKD
ncbi:MAG: DUF4251 domain-containing protein [Bacteroidales bacterium]|nr:DUF4251 domain-containing protein [Bacteroidales bacterium]